MNVGNQNNYIFDVKGKHLRGFLDIKSKEIVIFDDYNGKELFRVGSNHPSIKDEPQEQYEKAIISLEVRNSTNTLQTAILFAANREPLIQPLGITVIVKEIQSVIFNSHNYLRRDILTNPIKLHGMKYFADPAQFTNALQFGYIPPYGKNRFFYLQPENYFSSYQTLNKLIEVPELRGTVDANTQILVPVNPNTTCKLQFTALFKKTNGKSLRKNIYTDSPSIQSNFIDTYNKISGDESSINKSKINVPKILLTGAIISLLAYNVYLYRKLKKNI